MRIFYYQMEGGNVGDDLNASLWEHLIPDMADRRYPDWLIGIGTILNKRLDALQGSKVVMGSGYRPGLEWKPAGDLVFAAVRGSGTVEALGLSKSIACCDPGFLIDQLYPASDRGTLTGLVPHVYSELWSNISPDALDAGLEVISPRLPVGEFVARLSRCSRVFCESMHAAIFADALRIPWARVQICSHYYERPEVADFKWQDAFSVVGMPTDRVNSFGIVPLSPSRPGVSRCLYPLRRMSERRLARELRSKSADSSLFRLSRRGRLEECTSSLLLAIAQFSERQLAAVNA